MVSLFFVLSATSLLVICYILYWIKKHNPSLNYAELNCKNVIITGASTGIGEQISYEIAKGKANLLITGLEESLLSNIAQKCKKLGCKSVFYIAIDLSTTENCKKFVEKCLNTFSNGKIDYLFLNHALIGPYCEWINNKNISLFEKNLNKNLNYISQTMSININSHIIISTLLYKYLELNSSSIIYTSSLAGYGIQPYVAIYSPSKHAASAYFENWRLELMMNKSNINITICKLAMVATNSSLNYGATKTLSKYVVNKAANPNYIAKRIISGGQNKLKFVYAPFIEAIMVCIISKISNTFYSKITCKVNYGRFW